MSMESTFVPAPVDPRPLDDHALAELAAAVERLEHSSFAIRISGLLGRQIDAATQFLPSAVLEMVNKATMKALQVALKAAVRSLRGNERAHAANRFHIAMTALSGAAGGAFGLASLPVELPISTTIMLRSIADIAAHEGEDLSRPEALLACLEVFALGAGEAGPAGESGYLAMRTLLAKSVSEAARYMMQRGMADEAAPVILRFLSQIASRFGIVVGQKALSQAVPLVGALTGAGLNAAFTDHFQTLARAHFTVRRLERTHGEEVVRAAFERLRDDMREKAGRGRASTSEAESHGEAQSGALIEH